jgi:transposase
MSTAFISEIAQYLPNATMTFDRYRLAAKLSEAIDTVRRQEVATRRELKHTRWLWLKPHEPLGQATRRAPPVDAPLGLAGHARRCAGGRTPRPSMTSTPATHPSTCGACATA